MSFRLKERTRSGEYLRLHVRYWWNYWQVIQGHRYWCQSKAHMQLPISH